MYKHLLVATDGSKLAGTAVKTGIALAKSLGAQVTAFYAGPQYSAATYSEGTILGGNLSRTAFRKQHEAYAKELLDGVNRLGKAAGVAVETVFAEDDSPYEAIIQAARKRRCDLIVMASHGRKGLAGLLLGSETQKVLTHTKIPVLVVR